MEFEALFPFSLTHTFSHMWNRNVCYEKSSSLTFHSINSKKIFPSNLTIWKYIGTQGDRGKRRKKSNPDTFQIFSSYINYHISTTVVVIVVRFFSFEMLIFHPCSSLLRKKRERRDYLLFVHSRFFDVSVSHIISTRHAVLCVFIILDIESINLFELSTCDSHIFSLDIRSFLHS